MLKNIRQYGITLALFAAGSAGLTAAVNMLTQSPIQQQAANQQRALFSQIIPAHIYNNDLLKSCYLVTTPLLGKGQHKIWIARDNTIPVGVVMEATAPDGYAGAIQLLVAADMKGTILGVRVTEHHETPGLGDKIELRRSDWINQFAGKTVNRSADPHWAVKKEGGDFDQFTGATITPRAVVNAVKRAGLYAGTLSQPHPDFVTCGA
ncbi:electron transport complex subunit RsxG [Enterobacteriaceae bacterium ESL0689]|nr:electron transport complex subunit RsxG [Enterobacteriaceae bacterium ESL0689]